MPKTSILKFITSALLMVAFLKAINHRSPFGSLHINSETLKKHSLKALDNSLFPSFRSCLRKYDSTGELLNAAELRGSEPYGEGALAKLVDGGRAERYQPVTGSREGKLYSYANWVQVRAVSGSLYDDLYDRRHTGRIMLPERESVPSEQISDRLEAYGLLGVEMLGMLRKEGIVSRSVGLLRQRDDVLTLLKRDQKLAVAYSLMYAMIPVQAMVSEDTIIWMLETTFGEETYSDEEKELARKILPLNEEKKYKLFKPKKHRSVANRTNVYFTELYQSARKLSKVFARLLDQQSGLAENLFNDQASAWLMFAFFLYRRGIGGFGYKAAMALRHPERGKQLSTAIKGMGAQYDVLAAGILETEVMQGRGTGEIDLEEKMKERMDERNATLKVNERQLREEIARVLDEEMDMRRYQYETVDSFWTRRWAWGVNGSHSKVLEREEPQWKVNPPGLKRLHRRVYLEEVDFNPVTNWSGEVYVSCIKKVETKGERDLQSIDSNSYICFEHLMQGVEKSWRGKRAIIDPGKGGTAGMARRIRSIQNGINGAKLMVDYAGYDKQHTLLAQQLVVDELCRKIGYPTGMSIKLIESFAKMRCYIDGEFKGIFGGSLMSGHRLTTFINTVLNLAYLRLHCPAIEKCKSMHVGDDVFVASPDLKTVALIAEQLEHSPIVAKPEKQSMGTVSSEFLRMCTRGTITQGYLCRSIASCIMGQWVSDVRLSPEEGLQTMISAGWTIGNRSRDIEMADLLLASVCRITSLNATVASKLLQGKAALNDGPSRLEGMHSETYVVKFDSKIFADSKKHVRKARAVKDYLSEHIQEEDRNILSHMQTSVKAVMGDASYEKSEKDISAGAIIEPIVRVLDHVVRGVYTGTKLSELMFARVEKGVLEDNPILNLVKRQMDAEELSFALLEYGVGLTGYETYEELYRKAWGTKGFGRAILGFLPYGEASGLARACKTDYIVCGELAIYA